MIYVDDKSVDENDFLKLLEQTKTSLLGDLITPKGKELSGDWFEDRVFERMLIVSNGTNFEGHIIKTGVHAFPDIIAKEFYGVEVKMTIGNKWVSTGNSITESSRSSKVETIYMFFGKFGSSLEIKYRKYHE